MRESEETQHPDQKEIMGRNQDKYRGGKTREKNEAVRNKEMKVHEEKLITISEELENRYKRNGSCTIGETQNGTIGDTQQPTEGEGIEVDEGSKGKTRKKNTRAPQLGSNAKDGSRMGNGDENYEENTQPGHSNWRNHHMSWMRVRTTPHQGL